MFAIGRCGKNSVLMSEKVKISKENNTTILMVTHNPEIAKMANRVVRLRDGKISSIRVNLNPLKATDLVW